MSKRLRGQSVSLADGLLFRSDPDRDKKLGWITDRVVCRDCLHILAAISTHHLHGHPEGMSHTQAEYSQRWPGAPVMCERTRTNANKAARKYISTRRPEMRQKSAEYRMHNPEKIREYARNKRKDLEWREKRRTWEREEYYPRKKETFRARRAARWRPLDWNDKPIEWRIIGNELLSQRAYMNNDELADRLDTSRILKCPYALIWKDALNTRGFLLLVNKVRKWVKRQGGRQNAAA
jgi:hypothetical protein